MTQYIPSITCLNRTGKTYFSYPAVFILPVFHNTRAASTENTIQGTSDSSEKTSPTVPAVDGMSIRIPAAHAHTVAARLKTLIHAKINRAAAFNTYYTSNAVPLYVSSTAGKEEGILAAGS